MLPQEVIRRKRDGAALARDEVKDFMFGDVIGGDGRDHLALFPGRSVCSNYSTSAWSV